MRRTIATTLRLADDTTRQIVIRQAVGGQWSVVMIEDKPPRMCRRGHIVIGDNAYMSHGNTYCRHCQRHNKRMSRLRRKAKREAAVDYG
jgi:hypothetical protein